MTVQSNFPSIKPSLLLDFANVKALDPRITFTRTTTATYYDGVTTAKAEENLFVRSQQFNVATGGWAKTNITVTADTGAVTAPDGTNTAEILDEGTAASSAHFIAQATNILANTNYVLSCFAKDIDGQYFVLSVRGAASNIAAAEFDLSTGTLSKTYAIGTGFSVNATSITEIPSSSGWYRCVIEITTGSTVSSQTNYIAMSDGSAFTPSGNPSYTGTNRQIYIWGAQLEQRSAVSAYTPTTTAPITNYIPALQTAASGVARFDHNPTTGESLGLLVEEQRTNYQVYSQEFDNAAWAKARSSVTPNTIVAPDGTLTGDKLVEDTTASNTHYIEDTLTVPNNATLTFSFFAKAGERSVIEGYIVDSGIVSDSSFELDLSTGTVVSGANATITPVGNGWYRCSTYGTISGTSARGRILLSNGSTITYTGDGYSGVYLWGAQLEAGAFPTSYIATTSASVTRNADAASMTGTNFSSWFNNAEGTLYADCKYRELTAAKNIFSVSAGTSTAIYIRLNSDGSDARFQVGDTVTQVNLSLGSVTSDAKIIATFKANDFAGVLNGGSVLTDTAGTVPVVDTATLGNRSLNDRFLNGTIKKLAYYPQKVSDAQLQALTS